MCEKVAYDNFEWLPDFLTDTLDACRRMGHALPEHKCPYKRRAPRCACRCDKKGVRKLRLL